MEQILAEQSLQSCTDNTRSLLNQITQDILQKGYSIQTNALPNELADMLHFHITQMPNEKFNEAGIGRELNQQVNEKVRNDEIAWINGESPAGASWLNWTTDIQTFLNRRLFLGLFSFESHFAVYEKGHFYKRHLDAFKGDTNRVLSLVTYLNKDWQPGDGGELVIYRDENDTQGIKVEPKFGTVVIFLSEEFEHEVLPANTQRLSIAGWFRVNNSIANNIDPPR
ncbi:2OG-Fe(II) oxygenase [Glaciecola sp. 1036]|uniref:2OG-Fe(II) oxygenase n=1 Tax=Alteromonadaceae TaxID=72275 RepID=UPI003D06EE7E